MRIQSSKTKQITAIELSDKDREFYAGHKRTPPYMEVCSNRPSNDEAIRKQIEHYNFFANNCRNIGERIVIYTRVGNNDDHMDTIELQKAYYSELCKSVYGVEPAGFYVDIGLAGGPERTRLLTDCRAGKVDKIITKNISRFSRNLPNLMDTVKELRQIGVSILFELEGLDTSKDDDICLHMLISFVEQESEMRKAIAKKTWGHRTRGEKLKKTNNRSDKK